jgi:transcriptional regulator with XRE-family HTH domain
MTVRHVHRKLTRTPEETARLRAIRERYQRERPAPEQLLAEGGHDEFVTLGALLEIHQAAAWLKRERERQQLTLADMEARTGIGQAALSRLESGHNGNPTCNTIWRIAAALGKVASLSFADAPAEPAGPQAKVGSKGASKARAAKMKRTSRSSKDVITAKRSTASAGG